MGHDEDDYTMLGVAIGVEAGVLEQCEGHSHCWWTTGESEREAYRHAQNLLKRGDDRVSFLDRKTLLDAIKRAIDSAGLGGCEHCARIMAKD